MHTNLLLFLLCVMLLAGCGEKETPTPTPLPNSTPPPLQPGDAERGTLLFQQSLLGSRPAPGCINCHSLQPELILVGPSLSGVAARAATIIADPGYAGTAENVADYLHESITAPDVYVAPGFAAGVMHPTYGEELTLQEQADLVAYLLTLQ